MTSFGIEWDSDALVNIKQLPPGLKSRRAALKGPGFSITLEGIFFDDKRKINKQELFSDCNYTLEAQLGVIKSDKEDFFGSTDGLTLKYISTEFNNTWNAIIDDKQIIINDKPYPVLAYVYGPKNSSFFKDSRGRPLEIYKDCDLTSPGTIPDGNIDWAYIKNLDNILGKVQLTCGMRMKFIPNLFKKFTLLTNECLSHRTRCNTIPTVRETDMFLFPIKTAYINTWKELIDEKIFDEAGNTIAEIGVELSHNFLAYKMIFNYNQLIREKKYQEELKGNKPCKYTKACYSIKIRTNQAFLFYLFQKITKESDIYDYQQIAFTNIHEPGINPFEIFTTTPNAKKYLQSVTSYTPKIIKPVKKEMDSFPVLDFDEIKQTLYVSNSGDIDFGEWWSKDDTIHFELRTLEIITALINGAPYADQGPDLNEANIPASQINSYIQNIVDNFLNPMISLDITPILTQDISPPKRRRE